MCRPPSCTIGCSFVCGSQDKTANALAPWYDSTSLEPRRCRLARHRRTRQRKVRARSRGSRCVPDGGHGGRPRRPWERDDRCHATNTHPRNVHKVEKEDGADRCLSCTSDSHVSVTDCATKISIASTCSASQTTVDTGADASVSASDGQSTTQRAFFVVTCACECITVHSHAARRPINENDTAGRR